MSLANYQIPASAMQNTENFRNQLNAILADIRTALPTYSTNLPAATGRDGRMAYRASNGTIYQLQSGVWVPIT